MFDAGFSELVLLFIIGLLILGPERLPRVASQIGRWVGRARRTASQLRHQLEREIALNDIRKPPPRKPPPKNAPPAGEGGETKQDETKQDETKQDETKQDEAKPYEGPSDAAPSAGTKGGEGPEDKNAGDS